MRRAIGLFAVLIVAWPAWGGSLYVESFTGSEGSRPNGWSAASLAIREKLGSGKPTKLHGS
ncbi:MAG: hypothetical protein LC732_12325 [Acidobacteria bacterium]|nr:hypothetical protein [Acidobacteriota bacterium]